MGLFGDIWKGITGVPRAVGALLGAGDSDFGDFRGAAGALGDTLGLAAPILGATGVGAPAALGLGAIGGVLQKADDEGANFGDFVGGGLKGAAIGGAVGTVGGMMVGEHRSKKFCPVCGQSYTEDMVYCPKDGAELKYKQ